MSLIGFEDRYQRTHGDDLLPRKGHSDSSADTYSQLGRKYTGVALRIPILVLDEVFAALSPAASREITCRIRKPKVDSPW
jgi:hypothetical protein